MSEADVPVQTGQHAPAGGVVRDWPADCIQAMLAADARIDSAQVTLEPAADGTVGPLIWIVPAAAWIAPARAKAQAAKARMAVRLWARVFDTAYFAPSEVPAAPGFAGWVSSLTGAAIPAAEMALWRDHTVARIRALRPRHVLEIGCGLGLLLDKIAPDCASYRATDISAEAITRLQAWAATQPRLRHVEVAQRAAHELDDLAAGSVDTVILNSVVQYFPDFDYLARVLAAVLPLLSPGGQVFVGDVRDSRLLPVFNAAVQLARAAPTDTVATLRRAIHAHVETELAIDPRAFCGLPGYGGAAALLKQAGAENELTRYRYDVVLRAGAARPSRRLAARVWDPTFDSPLRLPVRAAPDRAPLLLRDIGNARLQADLATARLIRTAPAALPVQALRTQAAAAAEHPPAGRDPAALALAAERRGHRAYAIPASNPKQFSLLLSDPAAPDADLPVCDEEGLGPLGHDPPASDPLLARLASPLIAALTAELAARLPDVGPLAFAAVPVLPALG